MVDIVISIAAKVAEYLVAPVRRQLGYLFCYKSNIAELKDEAKKLDEARESLRLRVNEATGRGDEILPDVLNWQTGANDISPKMQKIIEDEKKAKESCFKGLCPNLVSRYQFSRKAKKKALDVKKIHEEGHFQTISYRPPLRGAGCAPPQGYQAFESRAATLKKIMDALRDDKINKIGVWGMGGVGKTTLVKQVAKLAQGDKLFDNVVMVAVSREQNLGKNQTEIIDLLGLKIKEKSELGRAERLSEMLKEKKLLIILDDIWVKLELEAVGIPYQEDHKGLKIVVTSRSEDVLSRDMGTQENFEVRLLSGDEAWQLFQDTAGGCIQKCNLQSVAMKVAEKCGDLPVAIVTVAKALKDKSVSHWEDALLQLTSPTKTTIAGMSRDVYKSLELSYNYLENEDAKSLFLLCGLLGYGDISMDDLFKYSVGLRLFPRIKTLEDSANRLQVLVDSLKTSSLLLDIHKKEYVKMHDVVRDVARDIASKDPHQFVVLEATQSEDWSEIRESTRYIHLSSSHQGTLALPQTLVCPKLEFFLLVNEGPSKNIPDSFFNGMGKLKVLRLFQMEFSSLPLPLQSLANLRTLCLDWCTLGDVAGIGELKQLEVLSFRGSDLKQLPTEIAQLTCLRLLDLSNCRQLRIIPPNILSNLSRLEHLCIEPQLKDEEINQESNAGLSELKHLSRLTTLNIALPDFELLPKDMVFEKLTRYKIFIGHWDLNSLRETKRALKLSKANRSLHLMDGIGKLLKKTEELSLVELTGTGVLYEFDKEDFLQLKHLNVSDSPEIQYIVDSKYPRVQERAIFPLLESLSLHELINLEKVCHGPIPKGSFGNLKTLMVWGCRGLKIFLSLSMATGFLHLENIEIMDCNVMQQIFAYERESEIIEDGHAGTTLQLFPKLRFLTLWDLPELMNFSSKLETSCMSLTTNARLEGNRDIHTSFFNHQVSFPNLEMLSLCYLLKLKEIWHHQLPLGSFYNLQILEVYNCPRLLNLIPSYLIHCLNHLKKIEVYTCEALKHVFDLQGLDGNTRILPKLESLRLWRVPRLRYIISNEDKINDNVRCLFSHSTLMEFHNFKFLFIRDSGNKVEDEGHVNTSTEDEVLFGEKVSFPNLEELEFHNLPKLKQIWHHQLPHDSFSNLRSLNISKCSSLLNLIPSHLTQNFKNLKRIKVDECGLLEQAFFASVEDGLLSEKVSFPNLEELEFYNLPKLKKIWHHQLPHDSFSNLRRLNIRKCSSLLNLIPSHLMQNFKNLKRIVVDDCEVLEHAFVVSVEDGLLSEKVSFPNLEELEFYNLPKLKQIWHHQLPHDSFSNLRSLNIRKCSSLLNLIPSHLMQNFKNLKWIVVDDCEVLEHAFVVSVEDGLLSEKVSFPNLEELEFYNLPKLKQIWHHQLPHDSFSNLRSLNIRKCSSLLNLMPSQSSHAFVVSVEDGLLSEKVLFPNLKELRLDNLPKLKEIWHRQLPFDSFSNLQILIVKNCPHLINLIPCHLRRSFLNLKEIKVSNCKVLKHVFDLQGLDKNIEILLKLETLKLKRLPNLKNDSLFSPSMPMNFHNLKHLSIKYCGKEDKYKGYVNTPIEDGALFGEKVSFSSNLEVLVLQGLPNLKEIDVGIFQKLKILRLENLPKLRLIICNEDKNDSKRSHLSLMFKDFHNLKELSIIDCGMEEQTHVYTSRNDVVLFNGKVSFPDGVCFEAFESRASTLNKIIDALRDGHINRIGVWGMGGVGKTTMLKQVAQQAKQQQLFTKQVYIDVSWTRDSGNLRQGISEIQRKIADLLGLEFEEDESTMADEIKQILQKENLLIILDDLWRKVDLEKVGILSNDDEIECKIVLTSKDGELLCKDMGVQKCFQVEHLPPQEAWSLFKKTVGDSMEKDLELRAIAIQVVEEYCDGMPIAIVTIAKALKDEIVAVWKNILEELRRSAPTNIRGVGNKVYSCLEWSYTHLEGDDVKSLFLLCGTLGYDDISVDLLLQYCLGLHMFDHIDPLEQTTNKLLTLVQILKASNLLFFNADNQSVRMHDVVIDVARAIAAKDPYPFIVREAVGFEEWSETDESKRCTFISLNCKLGLELPHRLVCPELQIFLLQNNNPSSNIPNTFFEGMQKLKVLDLSNMNFARLPSSLDSLANLRTLRLDGCKLEDIALIGKLTKLEVLSLVGSTIPQLPEEMKQLTNLRLLDLNDCKELKVIPQNILASLSRLECLCMKSSFTQWADEGESNASLSELNHLSHLTTLDIHVPNAELLPKDILFENLTRYTILIGHFKRDCKTKRALKLEGVLHLGDGIGKLLGRSEELKFKGFNGAKYVLYPLDRESFVELKHLKVSRSDKIQYIIDSKDQQFLQHIAFPLLESLVLKILNNLEEVWHGPIPVGSFGNLKTLHVTYCPKLKFLFVLSTARGLSQLEEMKIEDCDVMQQIIACERESKKEEDGHGETNLQLFPKLRTLKLNCLPQLINFTSGLETTSSTSLGTNPIAEGSFFNYQFSFPILEELTLIDLPKLKDKLFHQLLLGSYNLRVVKVSKCPYQLNLD